ncbi:chaperone GroEL [Candidatus Fokinia solitaria]|uniref:60 kDa chaperonin n=1 Tax=Candidatus Fokinia solitaria TaxID=1802984 RepID=A0A2U8BRX2_9RICK|nr:molecular chaperone GroEL [Candidatus Fokinia solitaria]AWD33091.1 chaperone GroEL [Candidatus Fokinia solitaria]
MATKTSFDIGTKVLNGVEKLVSAVETTFGPKGNVVIIERSYGAPKVTKDGVTVAKEVDPEDKVESMAVKVVQEAASQTNDKVGDGTTTTIAVAGALLKECFRMRAFGIPFNEIISGMQKAKEEAIKVVHKMKKDIKFNSDEVVHVATISANNDQDAGKLVRDAYQEVGEDGVVIVEQSKSMESTLEVKHGMQFDRGYVSPYFITSGREVEYSDVSVLLVDKKVSNATDLVNILNVVAKSGKPLMLIAEDFDNDVITMLLVNKMRGSLKVVPVKAPGFGDRRKAVMEDIAVITGATVITEELGMKLEEATVDHLGSAEKILVTANDTTIVANKGKFQSKIEARANVIQEEISLSKSDYDKEKLRERLAKLKGGVAIIRVGGVSEAEAGERKDRFEDAINAVKAAIKGGVVPGGGKLLLMISKELDKMTGLTEAENAGKQALSRALSRPARIIIENGGEESAIIIHKLLESSDKNMVYNVLTKQYVDAWKDGILDPASVAEEVLKNVVSVVSTLLASNAIITKVEDKKAQNNAGAAPHYGDDMY